MNNDTNAYATRNRMNNHDDVIKWKHYYAGHWWIPLIKGSDSELWYFLLFVPEKGWVNIRNLVGLRRHRARYGVTEVIVTLC